MFTNMFITWDGLIHVLAENGHRTLCNHEKPKKAKPHNDQSQAPICTKCLFKASPHIKRERALHEKKRYEPVVKPYKLVQISAKHHVKPLEGQMELLP